MVSNTETYYIEECYECVSEFCVKWNDVVYRCANLLAIFFQSQLNLQCVCGPVRLVWLPFDNCLHGIPCMKAVGKKVLKMWYNATNNKNKLFSKKITAKIICNAVTITKTYMNTIKHHRASLDVQYLTKFIEYQTILLCGTFGVSENGIPQISRSNTNMNQMYCVNFYETRLAGNSLEVRSKKMMRYFCLLLLCSVKKNDGILSELKTDNVLSIVRLICEELSF